MIEFTLLDHLYAFYLFLVHPLYGWRSFPAYARRVAEDGEVAKIRAFRHTRLTLVVFAAGVVALWAFHGRPWAELGFRSAARSGAEDTVRGLRAARHIPLRLGAVGREQAAKEL